MRAPTAEVSASPKTAPATKQPIPNWNNELELHAKGYRLIAGVDEAGRGAWAGPLVAGAVIFRHPDEVTSSGTAEDLLEALSYLKDSKLLSALIREKLLPAIESLALATGVGIVSPGLVDVIGVGPANRLAMSRAVRDLGVWPDFLLLDAFRVPAMPIPQRPIIKGDATCMSIAAASIVAKVARDHIMCAHDAAYPGYSFAQHKGYGTRMHVNALSMLGVSPLHRRSYAPIKAIMLGLPWPPPGEPASEEEAELGE
ncbi:MAG: ribonuclease HII [Chloroflexota bacterium]|nr:ribonuclease HII [Chloroflexota bacterium]